MRIVFILFIFSFYYCNNNKNNSIFWNKEIDDLGYGVYLDIINISMNIFCIIFFLSY